MGCKILSGDLAPETSRPRVYAELGYLDEPKLLHEMERYSDLFIKEIVRAGVTDMSLVVLCAEDGNDITRLTASARLVDKAFDIIDVHDVLFKTIDTGRDKIKLIYPRDGSHGSIADDKKELVVSHLTQFIEKLKINGVEVIMMTCGRGLTWLSRECAETQGKNLPNRMAG
jgi:hypothetical protein